MLFPVVDLILAKEDLAVTGTMHLNARTSRVAIDGGLSTEDHTALTGIHDRGAGLGTAGVYADHFARHPHLEHGLGHAVRRPRLLRSGLENESDLHRNNRKPQCVNTRRVAGQYHTEHRRLRLVAQLATLRIDPIAGTENRKIQPARQGVEDLVHVLENKADLRHVLAAHMLGKSGRRGLLTHEVVGRLRAIAKRQLRISKKLSSLPHTPDEIRARHFEQQLACPSGLAHVPIDEPAIGLTHLANRLTRIKMNDGLLLETVIWLAPTKNRKMLHESLGCKRDSS